MSALRLFFSFRGRASRSVYWLVVVVTTPVFVLELLVTQVDDPGALLPEGLVAWATDNELLLLVLLLTALWSAISVQVRRWHDRDKSGWWVLIHLVPLLGAIWALVENGLLAGTPGPNRYGPAPGQRPSPAHQPAPVGTDFERQRVDYSDHKQCPHCGEFVRPEPTRCRWCGAGLPAGWHHNMP